MLGNNQEDRTKTGLIVGIVGAVLIATAFIGWGLWQASEYEMEARDQARKYAAYTDKKIRQSCFSLTPLDKQNCAAQARHEQRDYERNERDLVAQRQSALWALIMGAAAVIGMGLSVIGVFLVWTTFNATRNANEISRQSLEVAREQGRALLDVTMSADRYTAMIMGNEGGRPALDFVLRNAGPGAAKNVTCVLKMEALDGGKSIGNWVCDFGDIPSEMSPNDAVHVGTRHGDGDWSWPSLVLAFENGRLVLRGEIICSAKNAFRESVTRKLIFDTSGLSYDSALSRIGFSVAQTETVTLPREVPK